MSIRLDTEVCRLFGIRYPLFLAGMAGGPGTAALTAAVSNAGGLGVLGAAYMEPEAIREAIRDIRGRTDAPFGVNLFATPMRDRNEGVEAVQDRLNAIRDRLGIARASGEAIVTPDRFEEQFNAVLDERVPVISTAFGLLPGHLAQQARAAGMRIVAMATTVGEALLAEQAGCDAVVAQGSEAGGHRGTFELTDHPMGAAVGTLALVPQVADRVRIPVIAAGGIMDGRGLVAALALGAQGAQLGTRFLTAAESGAQAVYREALLNSTEESTVITKAFSGRPARGIRNEFVKQWEAGGLEPLPFPTQNTATRDIRSASAKQGNAEYLSLWAGQGTRMLTAGQTAEQIVADVIRQAREILD